MRSIQVWGRRLAVLAMCAVGSAWAQGTPASAGSVQADPFVGTWVHLVGGRDDGLCEEVYRYDAAGTSEESSGPSRTKSLWRIEGGADPSAFRKLRIEIREHNGQRDCSGGLPPLAKALTFQLRVHPSGRWAELCSDAAGRRSCMVLWRSAP